MRHLLILFLTVCSLTSCKRTPTDVRGAGAGQDGLALNPEDGTLQVVVLSPGRVAPGVPVPGTLVGAGFVADSRISIAGRTILDARVVDANTMDLTLPSLAAGTYDVTVSNPDGSKAVLRSGLQVIGSVVAGEPCPLVRVFFALDRATLGDAETRKLDAQLACYQATQGPLRVEGHADERGTTDYNLALGQRRSEAVSRYLITAGMSASRLNTLSLGEERPLVQGHDEQAWSRNRRAEILVVR